MKFLDGDDRSVEAHVILACIAFIVLCAFQAYSLWLGNPFDASAYGMATGTIFGGGGAMSFGQSFLNKVSRGRGKFIPDNPD